MAMVPGTRIPRNTCIVCGQESEDVQEFRCYRREAVPRKQATDERKRSRRRPTTKLIQAPVCDACLRQHKRVFAIWMIVAVSIGGLALSGGLLLAGFLWKRWLIWVSPVGLLSIVGAVIAALDVMGINVFLRSEDERERDLRKAGNYFLAEFLRKSKREPGVVYKASPPRGASSRLVGPLLPHKDCSVCSHAPDPASVSNGGQRTKDRRNDSVRTRVTSCKDWKCPKCGAALEKPSLGTVITPGEDVRVLFGTATCPSCGSQYKQSDVYGGRYDIPASLPLTSKNATACSVCDRKIAPSSEFDLSTTASRIGATRGGLGFRCSSCGKQYCFSCLETAPQHPATGGRACPKCGAAIEMMDRSSEEQPLAGRSSRSALKGADVLKKVCDTCNCRVDVEQGLGTLNNRHTSLRCRDCWNKIMQIQKDSERDGDEYSLSESWDEAVERTKKHYGLLDGKPKRTPQSAPTPRLVPSRRSRGQRPPTPTIDVRDPRMVVACRFCRQRPPTRTINVTDDPLGSKRSYTYTNVPCCEQCFRGHRRRMWVSFFLGLPFGLLTAAVAVRSRLDEGASVLSIIFNGLFAFAVVTGVVAYGVWRMLKAKYVRALR